MTVRHQIWLLLTSPEIQFRYCCDKWMHLLVTHRTFQPHPFSLCFGRDRIINKLWSVDEKTKLLLLSFVSSFCLIALFESCRYLLTFIVSRWTSQKKKKKKTLMKSCRRQNAIINVENACEKMPYEEVGHSLGVFTVKAIKLTRIVFVQVKQCSKRGVAMQKASITLLSI